MSSIFQKFRYLIPKERTASGHQQIHEGGRDWENMYRDRWSFDKRVRSTHGVNCTGSCSWNIYVKDGLVAWVLVVSLQSAAHQVPVSQERSRGALARGEEEP